VCFWDLDLGRELCVGFVAFGTGSTVCVVVLDSLVLLEGRGGCAQGGVDSATWVSFGCCSVVPEALTCPLLACHCCSSMCLDLVGMLESAHTSFALGG
jgi:hypothetical protein